MTLLDRLGLHRRELRAWAMYDWANSAMVTTIVTAVFPIYFTKVAAAKLTPAMATQRLADITTIGLGIIAVLSPIMGDHRRPGRREEAAAGPLARRRSLRGGADVLRSSGATWLLATVLFVVANIAVNASYVCYDSFLPHIAHGDEMDRVSTAGYALGYVGGGILLALNLAWIQMPQWFGLPSGPDLTPAQATLPTRLAFVSVAVWWLVFSIPLFRHVPEPPPTGDGRVRIGRAMGELGDTFRQLGKFRQALLMLIAFLIYNDGIGTIIRMATAYGSEIGIGDGDLIAAIMIMQFVGIPFAFLFGSHGRTHRRQAGDLPRPGGVRGDQHPGLLDADGHATSWSSRCWWEWCRAGPRRCPARCSPA